MGNIPIDIVDPDGGKDTDWYLPKVGTKLFQAVEFEESKEREAY